jgi:hypothetical protein
MSGASNLALRIAGAPKDRCDWPEIVPITDAELRVMESHFAEELDELFGPRA